jgi:Tol biopolymer transport system component
MFRSFEKTTRGMLLRFGRATCLLAGLVLLALTVACGSPGIGHGEQLLEAIPPADTVETVMPTVTETRVTPEPTRPPTATATASETPQPTATITPTATPTPIPASGKIAFMASSEQIKPQLYMVNADGTGLIRLTDIPDGCYNAAWSPDGAKVVFESWLDYGALKGGESYMAGGLFVMNWDGSDLINLTGEGQNQQPAWSPDGTRIAFLSSRPSRGSKAMGIYIMNADGTEQTLLTGDLDDIHDTPVWSPDSARIAFTAASGSSSDTFESRIYVMRADGADVTPLTTGSARCWQPIWSPDGTRIGSNCGGAIWVMNADGTNQTQLSRGWAPGWSPDGLWIAFYSSSYEGTGISIMHPDGAGLMNLTSSAADQFNPFDTLVWSPDSEMIAFVSARDDEHREICIMNRDGTGQTRLTHNSMWEQIVAWLP